MNIFPIRVQRATRNHLKSTNCKLNHFKLYYVKKAAIIFVYVYGLITIMARNFDGIEKNEFMEEFVSYVPAMSSLQIRISLKLTSSFGSK